MKKKAFIWLRRGTLLIIWAFVIYSSYLGYNMYKHYQEFPTTEFKWDLLQSMPKELEIKMDMYNQLKNTILIAIGFTLLWNVFLYFENPEDHFFTTFRKKLEPMVKKLDDKLEDEEEVLK